MITLQKLAYEAMRLEYGEYINDDESHLSEKYVIALTRQALNTFLAPMIYQRVNEDDRSSLPLMIVRYTVSVSGNTLTLPEFYINLPFNKGLHGIALTTAPTEFFIPRHNPQVSNGLPCADLEPGQVSYWTYGYTVNLSLASGSVYVYLLVAAPDSITSTDALPIFPEMQKPLIDMVRQMMREAKEPVQQKIIDPNSDVGKLKR